VWHLACNQLWRICISDDSDWQLLDAMALKACMGLLP
jgi:hypothetical protein